MNVVYNAIKNAVDSRISEYSKNDGFTNLIITFTKENGAKYDITYNSVNFYILIEYINDQIKFSFNSRELISSKTDLYEITDFVRFIELMPTENLIKQIQYTLSK